MEQYLTMKEIELLLEENGIAPSVFSRDINYSLLATKLSYLPADLVRKVIAGGVFYNRFVKSQVSNQSLNSLFDVLNNVDFQALERYNTALTKLEDTGLDERVVHTLCQQIIDDIMVKNSKINSAIFDESSAFLIQADKFSDNFNTVKKSTKKDVVEKIYSNCISRMKSFYQKVEPENFIDILVTLQESIGTDSLTEDEVVELSSKCATIFCESSREKILGVLEVLSDYKEFCLDYVHSQEDLSADDVQKLKDFRIGQVLRNTASITKANTRTLYHTLELLKGKSVGEIFAHKLDTGDKNAKLYQKFKDAKLLLSSKDMVWALTKNPSMFTTSISTTLEVVDKVHDALNFSFNDTGDDLNASALLTRDNFFRGIPKNVEDENIYKNIDLLSCFMDKKSVYEYLKADMTILGVEFEELRQLVLDVFVNTKKVKNLSQNLNDILKCKIHEHIYHSLNAKKNKKDNDNQSKTQSVFGDTPDVKLDFEEIKNFAFNFNLEKLKTFLGGHYDDFVKSLKKNNINTNELNEIIQERSVLETKKKTSSTGVIDIKAGAVLERKNSLLDRSTNKIETLWQLQRNLMSAISLFNNLIKKGEDKENNSVYVATSNYLKLASEKESILSGFHTIDSAYLGTAEYLKSKIERTFCELTRIFVSMAKPHEEVLDNQIKKMKLQSQSISKYIDEVCVNYSDEDFSEILKRRDELAMLLNPNNEHDSKNQTFNIENELMKLNTQIQAREQSDAIRQRLQEVCSRLHYAENVKSIINQTSDEKE